MRRTFIVLLLLSAASLIHAASSIRASASPGSPPQKEAVSEKPLAVIVNRSNPLNDLSFVELKKIFRGERVHWPDGHRITLVIHEPGRAERTAVLQQVYRMSERDFNRYFVQATFTGEIFSAPKALASSTGVVKFVFNVPGAIGFVCANEADPTAVKVIRIDGLLPGEKGYKLRLESH